MAPRTKLTFRSSSVIPFPKKQLKASVLKKHIVQRLLSDGGLTPIEVLFALMRRSYRLTMVSLEDYEQAATPEEKHLAFRKYLALAEHTAELAASAAPYVHPRTSPLTIDRVQEPPFIIKIEGPDAHA
jgi:hypothetical protein